MSIEIEKPVKNDLEGFISVKFNIGNSFIDFCRKYISNFDDNRFDPLAIRVFYGKETIVVVYAVDRTKNDHDNTARVPVKKFKLENLTLADLLPFVEECNFTLTTGKHPLDEMEVINK